MKRKLQQFDELYYLLIVNSLAAGDDLEHAEGLAECDMVEKKRPLGRSVFKFNSCTFWPLVDSQKHKCFTAAFSGESVTPLRWLSDIACICKWQTHNLLGFGPTQLNPSLGWSKFMTGDAKMTSGKQFISMSLDLFALFQVSGWSISSRNITISFLEHLHVHARKWPTTFPQWNYPRLS